ncbi:hypothetical protein CRM22_005321 [Opisthorchis felineus]|uniref:Translocon-associated protein subunit gamma n=2 Tax=Opisthorchiidae TaxID=6196 RepID=A0A8T1MUY2_CLOSI|nr:SWI/SNF and RSC complex subunit Ssr3 [Clonorchis sinensis]TGZ66432.1 hypothetical protein CRM22_005321 [Opisthorchis felineus]
MAVKITKEDELLLEMYSRAASKKSDHLIYGNAILISLIPIWLFWRIHGLALVANSILYAIVSTACAFLMSYAYTGAKAPLMERVAAKRSESISKELAAETGKDKKLTRKERDDAVRERTREVADYESTTYSIFFNNCVYLLILLASSMVLQHFSAHVNYFISMLLASGLTAFLSSGKSSL